MKKTSIAVTARTFAAVPFLISGIILLAFSTIYGGARQRAILRPNAPVPTQFSGTYDPHVFPCATSRNHFTVPAGKTRLVVQVSAVVPTNDITVSLLFGPDPAPVLIHTEDTATSSEAYVYQGVGGVIPAGEYQVQVCQTPTTNGVPQMAPFDYNGIFTQDDTANPSAGGPPPNFGAIPQAPQDIGPKVGFENFAAPGVLVPVTTTSAGLQIGSVEYMGRNAGEPSVGNNWLTDTTVFYSDLQSLFVKFNDTCPADGLSSTWTNRPAPTAQAVDSDPIGFTDSQTGRSFSGQLTLLSPTCKTSYTQDDGVTWIPTQGSGIASGVDHQTIGGGRYAAPLNLNPPSPAYPHAVYYCSQEGVAPPGSQPASFCSRSDDGGLTFGPSIPITGVPPNCGGLHGHVKVSPKDGSVYVPFNQCDGVGSVVVSLNNGTTWTVRHVGTASQSLQPSASFQDPAVSIDTTGRVYYLIANNDTDAAVMTSDNDGQTWQNLGEVSSVYGLKNIRYPAATAGDAGRAAVAFYGTTTPGDALQGTFQGVWHLYVAHTFDGGVHWSTTDTTPNAPMQRGCIWAKGGSSICRNLLDFFDMTVDKNGRTLVGYVNGCEGGTCVQAPLTAQGEALAGQGNAYTDAATIARQSSGRRLFAANDPAGSTSKPGIPLLTQRRVANVVHLQWSEADTGNLMINSYQILRGTVSGGETFLAAVSGAQTGGTFTDTLPAGDTATRFYKVVAINSAGSSCGNNEVAAPFIGDTCSGIIVHRNEPAHREANEAQGSTPQQLLIDFIAVAEPPGSSDLLFKMKVNDLSTLPPNSRWRMVWDSFASPGEQFYVGMTTGPSGPPTFEYGTLADAGLPAILVISETTAGSCAAAPTSCLIPGAGGNSSYSADGTITLRVPKSALGNPQPGALLGAVNGRTITGDVPGSDESKLERSNTFIDHTFIKGQTDQSFPAATYLVAGNSATCGAGLTAVGAVSRKTHGPAGNFDVDLPLFGPPGIECRVGGQTGKDHKIVVTFPVPIVSVGSATVTPGGGGTASVSGPPTISGSVVTVNLTNVSNAQTLTVHLIGVSSGSGNGNVDIPMSVLLGDVTASKAVNASDVSEVKALSGTTTTHTNFRDDVTISGAINSSDVSTVKAQSGTGIP